MTGFIIRRLVSALLVVILTSILVFVLFFKGLGNAPALELCDQNGKCNPAKLAGLEHEMGLDKSVVTNYGEWAKGVFVGRTIQQGGTYDCHAPCFGISFLTSNQITDDLKQKYPATITLAMGGAAIELFLGIFLGAMAARWRGTSADRLLVGSTLVVSSIPYYLVALFAWIYLTLQLRIFPNTGYFPITQNPLKTISFMMLPWLCIGVTNSTGYARFTRGQMVETLNEDYIRTAQSKGVRTNRILFKHALRAAIVPVVTIFGLDFATLLAGTVFTEVIFDIDGIGQWGLAAIRTPLDFPVISTVTLVGAVLIVTANLVVDILYSFLDPRVSVS